MVASVVAIAVPD